ncbi:unnamed protein product [Brachionus calyciflorus]|uniref:Uncharacterized protein n=1 Tax=Brachionus calyciflorus TaxID=104777 RepID=A0A814MWT8_9BILA|nr:unnamed protein product [Brachionus calyciflorus]
MKFLAILFVFSLIFSIYQTLPITNETNGLNSITKEEQKDERVSIESNGIQKRQRVYTGFGYIGYSGNIGAFRAW